jgi:hypothetical protein
MAGDLVTVQTVAVPILTLLALDCEIRRPRRDRSCLVGASIQYSGLGREEFAPAFQSVTSSSVRKARGGRPCYRGRRGLILRTPQGQAAGEGLGEPGTCGAGAVMKAIV